MKQPMLALALGMLIAGCNAEPTDNRAEPGAPVPADPVADRNDATPVEMPFDEPPVAPAPQPSAPVEPAANDNAAADDPANETAAEPGPAAARATVVRYFEAIARRDYGSAYALWEPGSAGMSARAFARSFARYRRYHAEVGRPGRIDSGAGQRYVEVPVTVRAVAQDGRRVTLGGSVTLHRTAAIDGATAEQRRWRIRESALK